MYNYGVFLANKASEENNCWKQSPENKHQYEVDFSTALGTARDYFCGLW